MSSLFIANTSKKHHEFLFRLPGSDQMRRIYINAGTQQEVLKDAQREEIDYVIKQHLVYGLVEASQAGRIDKFAGTLYSVDKPVPLNAMGTAMDKNDDILLEEGFELRKIAAVATNAMMEDALASDRNAGRQRAIEVEVQEIEDKSSPKSKLMKQKIKVAKD